MQKSAKSNCEVSIRALVNVCLMAVEGSEVANTFMQNIIWEDSFVFGCTSRQGRLDKRTLTSLSQPAETMTGF
jgi:hypothetical protein